MAQIIDNRFHAWDANGNPSVGATLTIYDANTTTPTAIFKDAALTVACTNPTSAAADISDAGGWFPQLFAAEGTVVDITMKTSGGATLKTWEDVTFVGADSGDISRTVTGSGRIKFTGTAGAVLIQAGDPSPDNVGGTLTIEGQAGTQLDSLTLDAALVNVTGATSAALKVNSRKITGTLQTEATTFTAQATVDIPLTNTPTGVIGWKVLVWFTTSAATAMLSRLSFDGGATYKAGAADYSYATLRTDNVGGVAQSLAATSTSMLPAGSFNSTFTRPCLLEMTVLTVNSGTDDTMVMSRMIAMDTNSANIPALIHGAGYGRGSYGRADHIRLIPNGGVTMTGKYMVEAIYGLGET